jgi:hypothetical protein
LLNALFGAEFNVGRDLGVDYDVEAADVAFAVVAELAAVTWG